MRTSPPSAVFPEAEPLTPDAGEAAEFSVYREAFEKRGFRGAAALLAFEILQHGIEYARQTIDLAFYEAAGDAQKTLDDARGFDLQWRVLPNTIVLDSGLYEATSHNLCYVA